MTQQLDHLDQATDRYDVIVVGARAAGATTAIALARAGRRVLVVERDPQPSDTLSTHQLFPHTLTLLEEIGALQRLHELHRLTPVRYDWRVLGHPVAGSFTPVAGHDRSLSVRRITLDSVLQQLAEDSGAQLVSGVKVVDLLGSGRAGDPVHGVRLDDGRELVAPWVVGADGRRSFVARRAGAATLRELRGEVSALVAYWEGLPPSEWCHLDMHETAALQSSPCEDGLHLLAVYGGPELTRGSAEDRQAAYLEALRRFPAVLNPRLLHRARQVTPVAAAPETMMRGHVRQATGPGWVLVGDAGVTSHPSTAQGIAEAVATGWYVGRRLAAGSDLTDFEQWRDHRVAGHLEFSFRAGHLPRPEAEATQAGLAADPVARQEFLDTFTKRVRPQDVFTPERTARWKAAWIYERGLAELLQLLWTLPESDLGRPVPACPGWRTRDLVAHLVGVATDSTDGAFFAGAMGAWADAGVAAAREDWTATQVDLHRGSSRDELLRALRDAGTALVAGLRAGRNPVADAPDWGWAAPVGDLAVHVADLREALGLAPRHDDELSRYGFAAYRSWLDQRLHAAGRPGLTLSDGVTEWSLGPPGSPAVVTADRHSLFRMISGRRSEAEIRRLSWQGDPGPYLDVVAPYPLPVGEPDRHPGDAPLPG